MQTLKQAQQNQLQQAYQTVAGANAEFDKLRDFYNDLGERLVAAQEEAGAIAEAIEEEQLNSTVVISTITLIIILVLVTTVPRLISSRINALTGRMQALGQSGGDLTVRLPVEGDNELAQLAKATNQFVEYLTGLLSEIDQSVEDIARSGHQITQLAGKTTDRITTQAAAVQQFSTSVSELNDAIAEVARQLQLSSEATDNAKKDVHTSGQQINQTIALINDLAGSMASISDVVANLEKRSADINSVLEVIGGIAEQTNLLALNAAIEAARAGETGRGFAVVADEVRALAQKTQESTQTIQDSLNQLSAEVTRAVNSANEGQKVANATSSAAESTVEAMSHITQRVQSVAEFSLQIATATEEQSYVVQQLADSVESMRHTSETVTHDADETLSSVTQVESNIGRLKARLNSFKF
ncbi:methyl-accepting chemotaxis protein [Maribrevibacterium harenarium]|uniref:Methyl-accepting chemotaxis protein n=1 Tax=Maribrevibacterium harenarium TaxID=2589817 RepID=A0A501WN57_9GAMM|nr:methyl-accepting chemotaxis protein [Maribrevibacterium harenarium]TPE49775.1 methyl-accepting chemotaxis protein [Maribrevibacterium harenarium]